jgi:hypothetical protein
MIMSPRLALFLLIATCALMISSAEARTVRAKAANAHGAGTAPERPLDRVGHVTLSPAPGDLALAEIAFHGPSSTKLTARGLQVAGPGALGDDYLAVASARFRTPGGPRVLVLLVNRPSPLLDPVNVRLRLSSRRALGAPRVRTMTNAFARAGTGVGSALCGLPLHGSALRGSELRALGSRAAPLTGFDTADAVAQAYDAVCGLHYASAFKQVVTQPLAPTPPAPTPPPAPAPPVPAPPGCTPCDPPPGYACPLVPAPDVCIAPVPGSAGRAAAGAH